MNLTHASATEIAAMVRGKKVKATEVVEHFLARIKSLDGKVNSFLALNEKAVDEAKAVDNAIASGKDVGALAGVPVAVKDLICTRGIATTAASKILQNFIPPYSATLVTRLQAAGAIVLGKTNLDEFAMGSSNETSAFGICRNPWNTDYVPGGSSGGSAAALAARLAPIAIGTDTGGSIRQPASFCGVTGIKPTYGRISRFGVIAYASSLDQAGPMAHSSRDCATVLQVMSGQDSWDSTSSERAVPDWSKNINSDLKGMRVGILKEGRTEKVDADTTRAIENAIAKLKELGAEIVDVSVPMLHQSVAIYYLIATSEASSNLARYDGVRYGHRSNKPPESLDDFYANNRSEAFGTEVKRRIMLGTYALSSGYYDAYYIKAGQVRRMLRDQYTEALKKCDVILSPVTTSPAFKIGERISDPLAMYYNDIFTTSANLAGLPSMSVPAGYSAGGLPIGVQLTAAHFDEQSLFNIGEALEKNLQLEKKVPHVI